MKRILLMLLLLATLTSCASLPLVNSSHISHDDSKLKYYYDIDNNIAYNLQHDNDFLYLIMKTDDEMVIQKMIRNGLFIYIDPNGGKSKGIYFNYPLKKKPGEGEMRKMMDNRIQPGLEREFNVNQLLETLGAEAIYSSEGTAEMIPVFAKSNDFKVEMTAPTNRQLIYKLRIPLNDVIEKDNMEFSLGIMTGKFEMPSMNGGRPGGNQGVGMQSGMSGGGMQSGGRPGEMQGGPGSNMNSENREAMIEQVSLWFKVNLNGEQE